MVGRRAMFCCLFEIFCQVKLGTLVILATLQLCCKLLSNLHEIELSSVSVLWKSFILF